MPLISPSPKEFILIYWRWGYFLKKSDRMQVFKRMVFSFIYSANISNTFYFLPFSLIGFVIVPLSMSIHTILELRFFLKWRRFYTVWITLFTISIKVINSWSSMLKFTFGRYTLVLIKFGEGLFYYTLTWSTIKKAAIYSEGIEFFKDKNPVFICFSYKFMFVLSFSKLSPYTWAYRALSERLQKQFFEKLS